MTNANSTPPARQIVGKRRQHRHVQQRGTERRRLLLSAAETLLATVPVEELSFKRISEVAGVPEGSAYHFFANKYDLLTALAADLAERFAVAFQAPFASASIESWHDLSDLIVERAVEMYGSSPAATKIWLGGRTPPEIKLADRIANKSVSNVLQQLFEREFVLPDLPRDRDVFFHYMELADVILSLSVIQFGEITPVMLEEAQRAGRSYLSSYLPAVLERQESCKP
jgi:AcrR family transcriptional regulator